jgi:hypothetical protein
MARYRCLDLKLVFAQCRVPKPLSRIYYGFFMQSCKSCCPWQHRLFGVDSPVWQHGAVQRPRI